VDSADSVDLEIPETIYEGILPHERRTIEGTLLRMTERKMSKNSRKCDLSKWPERSDYRHDALLRVDQVKLDAVVVEAKPTESTK
ncbi:hypothetical protein BGX34_005182, partial [Mortierella sp. NVP85]